MNSLKKKQPTGNPQITATLNDWQMQKVLESQDQCLHQCSVHVENSIVAYSLAQGHFNRTHVADWHNELKSVESKWQWKRLGGGQEVSWAIFMAYAGVCVGWPSFFLLDNEAKSTSKLTSTERKNQQLAHCLTHWTRTALLCVCVSICVCLHFLQFSYGKTIFTQHIRLWWIDRASQFPYNPVLS